MPTALFSFTGTVKHLKILLACDGKHPNIAEILQCKNCTDLLDILA